MSDIAIRVEGLGKRYRIGERERYKALRDVITDAAAAPFRKLRSAFSNSHSNGNGANGNGHSPSSLITHDSSLVRADSQSAIRDSQSDLFWALKDVSFEVKRGEVVGIIGRNGAGKSTLLKILSRITAPTTGEVEIKGRVGSLLEVGTGFHPELTGRENIYLNGAILGMKRAEINRKFDEMVAFAEIEKFIDTPVKRYSSGMFVRLAFAVAAHLDPEILLVDEVLAVGDAQFQKKCFEKMKQVRSHGRTIFLVSHNMSALRLICSKGIALDSGHVILAGEVNAVCDWYLQTTQEAVNAQLTIETPTYEVEKVEIKSMGGQAIKTYDDVEIRVRVKAKVAVGDPGIYFGVLTMDGRRLAGLDFRDFTTTPPMSAGETAELGFLVTSFPLMPGNYALELQIKDMAHHKIELVPVTYPFVVVETPVYGGRQMDRWFGNVALRALPLAKRISGLEI